MLSLMDFPAQRVKEYLERFGNTVHVAISGTGTVDPYKAIIHPLRYKNKMYLDGIGSKIGYVDQSHYLYIGPADVDICSMSDMTVLTCNDISYRILRAEKVDVNNETVYIWAVIRAYSG